MIVYQSETTAKFCVASSVMKECYCNVLKVKKMLNESLKAKEDECTSFIIPPLASVTLMCACVCMYVGVQVCM